MSREILGESAGEAGGEEGKAEEEKAGQAASWPCDLGTYRGSSPLFRTNSHRSHEGVAHGFQATMTVRPGCRYSDCRAPADWLSIARWRPLRRSAATTTGAGSWTG
jgi:hypothetical protein